MEGEQERGTLSSLHPGVLTHPCRDGTAGTAVPCVREQGGCWGSVCPTCPTPNSSVETCGGGGEKKRLYPEYRQDSNACAQWGDGVRRGAWGAFGRPIPSRADRSWLSLLRRCALTTIARRRARTSSPPAIAVTGQLEQRHSRPGPGPVHDGRLGFGCRPGRGIARPPPNPVITSASPMRPSSLCSSPRR